MKNEQKRKNNFSTSTMTMVALMAAVLCVLAPFSIPVGPVPISLATFGLYVAVMILGGKNAVGVCLMYLLMGYMLLTAIAGRFVDKFPGKRGMCAFGLVMGTVACYAVGTVWMAVQMEISFSAALMVGVVPFLVGDVVKIIIAVWLGYLIRRRIRKAEYDF